MSEDDSVKHEGKWTRADLPQWDKIRDADDMAGNGLRSRVIDIALNEVVHHLNAHYPKPEPDKWRAEWVAVSEGLKAARRQSDLAHEQWQKWKAQARRAESGRDAAVASAEQLDKNLAKVMSDYQDIEDECDELKKHLKVTEEVLDIERKQHEETSDNLVQANQRWLAAMVERDEWKASAETAERERDELRGRYATLQHEYTRQSCTWGRKRADYEARLAKAAPAVTREDVEKAIRAAFDGGGTVGEVREMADTVWSLVSGADPAVFVVRESNVEAQAALRNRFGEFVVNGTVLNVTTAEDCREKAQRHLGAVARCESIARAIEAEPADPLLDKAQEFAALAAWELTDREAVLLHTVAAHILGQEIGDE